MVNRNLLRQYDLSDSELENELAAAFSRPETGGDVENWLLDDQQEFESNKVIKGRIARIEGDDVVIDIGYKSEGVIPLNEWFDEATGEIVMPKAGEDIQVLLESVEDETGNILLSYRKAKRQKEWEMIISKHKEGDVIIGLVTKKIKGGLLVNIGVNVFLPASQVDIRRPLISAITSTAVSSAKFSKLMKRVAISSSAGVNCLKINAKTSRKSCSQKSNPIKFAKVLSRISQTSAHSSISAVSMACCTSPT